MPISLPGALAFLLVASSFVGIARAQSGPFTPVKLAPGDERIQVDRLQPYTARWTVTAATPDNRIVQVGEQTEELSRGDCPRACWRRTLRAFNAAGKETMTTTNLFDARTLEPLSTEQRAADGTGLTLRFDGRRVRGRQDVAAFFHVPEHHRNIDGRLKSAALDFNNGPSGLYLALMPHTPLTTLRFPVIDVDAEDPLDVVSVDYRIFNRQDLKIGDRSVPAAAIDHWNTYGYWQFWVTEEPPYVVRRLYVGPGGGRTMYTLAPSA